METASIDLVRLKQAVDRLENLFNLITVPDSIYVAALREGLPEILAEMRQALEPSSRPLSPMSGE